MSQHVKKFIEAELLLIDAKSWHENQPQYHGGENAKI
jgi:hypothetical protein